MTAANIYSGSSGVSVSDCGPRARNGFGLAAALLQRVVDLHKSRGLWGVFARSGSAGGPSGKHTRAGEVILALDALPDCAECRAALSAYLGHPGGDLPEEPRTERWDPARTAALQAAASDAGETRAEELLLGALASFSVHARQSPQRSSNGAVVREGGRGGEGAESAAVLRSREYDLACLLPLLRVARRNGLAVEPVGVHAALQTKLEGFTIMSAFSHPSDCRTSSVLGSFRCCQVNTFVFYPSQRLLCLLLLPLTCISSRRYITNF